MNDPSAWIQSSGLPDPEPPPEVDLTKASISRVYDYVLGGKHHFGADRRAAYAFIDVVPEAPLTAQDNRNFLRRGMQFLVAEAGIRQIIDIGSGLPTVGNVHEIAQEINPGVRVVYEAVHQCSSSMRRSRWRSSQQGFCITSPTSRIRSG